MEVFPKMRCGFMDKRESEEEGGGRKILKRREREVRLVRGKEREREHSFLSFNLVLHFLFFSFFYRVLGGSKA